MILSHETDIDVVGGAASGEEGLPLIRQLKPDVLVCDLHLPGVSGLEVTERVRRWDQGSRVIIVSVQEEGPMPRRLLEVGASGYLGKGGEARSEEHTSELQSLMRISYAVFCLKKKTRHHTQKTTRCNTSHYLL